jgi:ferredoxin-NADP reductase
MEHRLSIHSLQEITDETGTHPILEIVTEKPSNFSFSPGQAVMIGIDKEGLHSDKRPFTIISTPSESSLAFLIKVYPEHNGLTQALRQCQIDDALIISDPIGSLAYKGEGIFISGGTGVNPFFAMGKYLAQMKTPANNILVHSCKTETDCYKKKILTELFDCHFFITQKDSPSYTGRITKDYLTSIFRKNNISETQKPIYICGPEPFVAKMTTFAKELGATNIIKEEG